MLKRALTCADAPNAQKLALLSQTTEPPRQGLLRRINRSPGGALSIVAMRRAWARSPSRRRWKQRVAQSERLNVLGDLSLKVAKQSLGLMVNCLYDLRKIAAHQETFVQGEVARSRAVSALL